MNKIITIFLCLVIVTTTYAQLHICGVTHDDQIEMVDFVSEYNKRATTTPRSADPIYFPIKF